MRDEMAVMRKPTIAIGAIGKSVICPEKYQAMKKLLNIIGLFFCVALAQSAQAQVTGKVVDLAGNGIPDVLVSVSVICGINPPFQPLPYTAVSGGRTDAQGKYSFDLNIPCRNFGQPSFPFASKNGFIFAPLSIRPAFVPSVDFIGTNLPAINSMSAASFVGGTLAGDEIIAAFGAGLSERVELATTTPLPTTLAGRKLLVKDTLGVEKAAELMYVSPRQINFIMPAGLAHGTVILRLIADDQAIGAGFAQLQNVAPGLFTANADGIGVLSGLAVRVKPDGSQHYEEIAQFDAEKGKFVPRPIDLGAETDQVYLALFGTGLRNRSSLSNARTIIDGVWIDALYAGPQLQFPGLDQINVLLPRSLAGRGEVDVLANVDSIYTNKAQIIVK